jgi:hypothetical protein
MANIADKLGETGFEGGEKRSTLTPQEASNELTTIMSDMKGPYYNDLDPRHEAIVERVIELQTMSMS